MTVKGNLDLKPPLSYQATLNVEDWDLATIVTLIPNTPQPAPVRGRLSAQAEAQGTISPWTLTTDGKGQLAQFQAGPVPLGDVPFRWMTDRDSVLISDVEARPFGGRFSAEATIPVTGGGSAEGSATFSRIDTAQLCARAPGAGSQTDGASRWKCQFRRSSQRRGPRRQRAGFVAGFDLSGDPRRAGPCLDSGQSRGS